MSSIFSSFKRETGEYIGIVIGQESPLEPGEFLRPAYSLKKLPPPTGANECAVFAPDFVTPPHAGPDSDRNSLVTDDSDWDVRPDFRGQTFYDQITGQPTIIDALGAVPASLVSVKPPPSVAEVAALAAVNKASFMAVANDQVSILTDATDINIVANVNPSDVTLLAAWKKYRQLLRVIDTTASPVVWPDTPDSA